MAPSPDRPGDMPRMQQEALRRVQEMQAKAHASGGDHPPESPGQHREQTSRGSPDPPPPTPQKPPSPQAAGAPPAPIGANGISDIFQSLMKDKDRTLILILILLLANEETDTGLVLALMYLLI